MFNFLNRNKSVDNTNTNKVDTTVLNSNLTSIDAKLQLELTEAKKNLYDSIVMRRTDIVVSFLNEWLKEKNKSEESVKYFFNSNYCENGQTNPLLVAYNLKDRDLVRALLIFGADPGLIDNKQKKSLTQLVKQDKSEQFQQVLSDCFMQLIVQNNLISLKHFISSGFEINSKNETFTLPDNNSYLHWAALYSTEPIVRFLLENGADPNCLNDKGATPLHECIAKQTINDETLHIVETLLVFKSDLTSIKGKSGIFKDQTCMDLALNKLSNNQPEVYNLIKDFLSDASLSSTVSSTPSSPLTKSNSVPDACKYNNAITHALDSLTSNNNIDMNVINSTSQQFSPKPIKNEFEFLNWYCESDVKSNESIPLTSLIWPKPQICTILSDNNEDKFLLNDVKSEPFSIYIKPPHTYSYMDLINTLASSFSGMAFTCIHKPIQSPHICVTINSALFQQENSYSILVTDSKIDINASDEVGLQYAFFTFIQLCKIYARSGIPSLRIIDYPDVKYRAVLFDFSQGLYFRYEYFLALLQMLTFYKINQVHFYVKFSSLQSDKKQWYHCISNWYGLMKFCDEVNLQVVPAIDITTDVAELCDVHDQIKEYLDLFVGFKYVNIGPRLSSLITFMENKNPFSLDSSQYMMLCSYLFHTNDNEISVELDKLENYILMEYGLKSGYDFESKSLKLFKTGRPFFYCVGSANWNSFLGCPEACLHNIFDAVKRQPSDQALGMLLCNFNGSLCHTAFAFNLNAIVMLAGSTWNTKINLETVRKILPDVIKTHGLIKDKDGEIGAVMLELGHLETFLTRKSVNSFDFNEFPLDQGSLFAQLSYKPDDIDLDYLDKTVFKKCLFHLKAQHSKLKSLLNTNTTHIYKEVLISCEIAINLFKFLIVLYNSGTRNQISLNKAVGFSVINIGVTNLNQTIRTDLANKLLMLKEEYSVLLPYIYHEENIEQLIKTYSSKLIDKLLIDQTDLKELKQNISMKNSSLSSYFIQNE